MKTRDEGTKQMELWGSSQTRPEWEVVSTFDALVTQYPAAETVGWLFQNK